MPEESPAAVTIRPLSTHRLSCTTRAFGARAWRLPSALWKVVAVSPSRRPALASHQAPLQTDNGQVTEAVSEITWTGGTIAPGQFDDFEVSVGPLPSDVDVLLFPAVQTYSDGTTVSWIQAAIGQKLDNRATARCQSISTESVLLLRERRCTS